MITIYGLKYDITLVFMFFSKLINPIHAYIFILPNENSLTYIIKKVAN